MPQRARIRCCRLVIPSTVAFLFLFGLCVASDDGLPDLGKTVTDPVLVNVYEDATLTCTVKDLGNYTLVWKRMKYGRFDVLSANSLKVTNDPRVSIMHMTGGDDYVLTITRARTSDTAQYICEANSIPAVQVAMLLTVKPPLSGSAFPLSHNYTECCIAHQVSEKCLGFCSLQNIVLGSTGASPQSCRDHLPVIASCMADGRNHTKCCVRERIPEVCRDVCVGKFGLLNETIVNHYTCSRHSRVTLACIAEGVELLPGPPRDVYVEPQSDQEILVSWQVPSQNANSVSHYILNVTELTTFDGNDPAVPDFERDMDNSTDIMDSDKTRTGRMHETKEIKYSEINVNSSDTTFTLKNLKPFTMYEISLISVNSYGTSLPTYRLRTLTLVPPTLEAHDSPHFDTNATVPELPDIRGCCAEKGMTQTRCLDLFCDPVKADVSNLTDMMICAPWINISVQCLANGIDHTPCCQQRGLPKLCLPLCQGNVTRIDFRWFRCIAYMDAYTSCLMQGYGVVPSSPRDLILKSSSPHWTILKWKPPENLTGTVKSYNVHYRNTTAGQLNFWTVSTSKSPFLLDNLIPDTEYEVYVTAVNQYGAGEPTPHLIITTLPKEQRDEDDGTATSSSMYNVSDCCMKVQLKENCLPLCSYRARMTDLQRLAPACMGEFHKLLKCGVGGRNHMPCCLRRMVSANCASLCAGMLPQYTSTTSALCIPYIPDIIQCMEEGSNLLPGPIQELHATFMNSTFISLEWQPPVDSNITSYVVHCEGDTAESTVDDKPPTLADEVKNVTETFVSYNDLKQSVLYSFYVLAVNEHGSSMPSSILTFNTSSVNEKPATGVVSPPHSLTIISRNTSSLTLSWLPPDFSHPHDIIQYTVYHKADNESEYMNISTSRLNFRLTNLPPNAAYIFYVTASTKEGESWPSENIRAWTEPVYPAFVEMPRIHPSTQIEEGGSMTILCVASGTPVPTVAVYINGHKYLEEVTRHMVTRINNVTHDMDTVTCTADNGHETPSQATKYIKISYAPKLEASRRSVTGTVGRRVILECLAAGFPQPSMSWWHDHEKQNPVIQGSDYVTRVVQDDNSDLVMQLIISNPKRTDAGVYYCNAQNPYGNTMDEVYLSLEEPPTPPSTNVTACCLEQNVHPDCLEACVYEVNLEAVTDRPQCITELSKLMYCAADGSDHRRCCQMWGVPRRCIGWCQGKAVQSAPLCVLAWSKPIITCFQEGKDVLPGVPENVHVNPLTTTSALIEWDPPSKNPHTVQYYRVYAKPQGNTKSEKFQNDTHSLSMVVTGLRPSVVYEFTVKAANHNGASMMSMPLRMTMMNGNSVVEASTKGDATNSTAIAIGIILTVIIIAIAAVAYLYIRKKYQPQPLGGVSFENPSYMRETNNDAVQINGVQQDHSNNGSVVSGDVGWKSEALHTPDTDALYEVPSDTSQKRNKNGFS